MDASPEMIAINRARLAGRGGDSVAYVIADIFVWQPERQYDAACFGFWISHVPLERLDQFLRTIALALHPGGKVFSSMVGGSRAAPPPTTTCPQ